MSAPSIAFIGTGVMGRSMAGHLLKAGHTLHVYNRTKARAQDLLAAGAHWHDTAGAAAAQADFVFTIAQPGVCWLTSSAQTAAVL